MTDGCVINIAFDNNIQVDNICDFIIEYCSNVPLVDIPDVSIDIKTEILLKIIAF